MTKDNMASSIILKSMQASHEMFSKEKGGFIKMIHGDGLSGIVAIISVVVTKMMYDR